MIKPNKRREFITSYIYIATTMIYFFIFVWSFHLRSIPISGFLFACLLVHGLCAWDWARKYERDDE